MSEQEKHNDADELSTEDLEQVTGGVAQVGLGVVGQVKAPGTQKFIGGSDDGSSI